MDVISQEDLITYESLVQEATREYRNLVDSKWWEPATSKEKSQDQPSLPKAYTVAIEQSINKALKQVDFRATTVSTAATLEINLLQSLVD